MTTKYEYVKESLIKRFIEEKYEEGRQIPTEFELVGEMGVSRNTIRLALKKLEDSGVIYKEHGRGAFYSGNGGASGKKNGNSKGLIGLINLFLIDYIYSDIVRGIEDTLFDEGYSLAISNCYANQSKGVDAVKRLLDQNVSGLILEPSRNAHASRDRKLFKLLAEADIPVVTTHWNLSGSNFSMVSIDDEKAGRKAADLLIGKGHRKVGCIYRSDVQSGNSRLKGFRMRFQEEGIPLDERFILSFDDSEGVEYDLKSYCLTKELINRSQGEISAIFYYNDYHAMQGYRAIKEKGLTIPDDISVIGFDDYQPGQIIEPALTTFMHPKFSLGRWTAKILLEEIESKTCRMPMNLIFDPILIDRGSVRALN